MSDQHQMHEFPCPGPISATIRAGAGSVMVSAAQRAAAVVSVAPYDDSEASQTAAEQTTVSFTGDRLRVETPQYSGVFRRSGRVRIDLEVPLDSQVRAQVGSADVHTEGRLSDVSVQAGSGDTYVGQAAAALDVESGSGDVRAEDVGGVLRIKTGSGDISITSVTGPATVHAASGDVEIERANGAVRVTTASGDVTLGAAHGDDVQINSASGDVSVAVPAGTRVWLDLSTMSGTTNSDLDMTGDAAGGGAGLRLHVQTMSGDIAIRRTASATA